MSCERHPDVARHARPGHLQDVLPRHAAGCSPAIPLPKDVKMTVLSGWGHAFHAWCCSCAGPCLSHQPALPEETPEEVQMQQQQDPAETSEKPGSMCTVLLACGCWQAIHPASA